MSALDTININPQTKAGLHREYAKARTAIEGELNNRRDIRRAKLTVIEVLGGTLMHPENPNLRKYVQFPDETKAVF